jgi:hypothetical protein
MRTLRIWAAALLAGLAGLGVSGAVGGAAVGAAGAAGAAGVAGSAATPAAPPALAGITGLHQEVVLSGVGVDGNRLDLYRFADRRPLESLEEEVRRIWSQRQAPVHSTMRDGWLVLTQVVGSSLEMLELRPRGSGSEGRWSRLQRGDARIDDSAWLDTALPPGSRILKRLHHDDGGRRLTTLVAVTPTLAAAASEHLAANLRRSGFTSDSRGAPSFAGAGLAFFVARGSEDIAITVSEHEGQCALVLHWGRSVP